MASLFSLRANWCGVNALRKGISIVMQRTSHLPRALRYPFSLVWLTAFALIATFLIVGGLIYLSARKSDEQALASQRILVQHLVNETRKSFVAEQEDVVAWDSAVRAVTNWVNIGWLSDNLGHTLYSVYDHELVFILRPNLTPIYAMNRGIDVHTTSFGKYADVLLPMARDLKALDATGVLTNYTQGRVEDIPHVSDVAMIGDRPALVSVMPIASASTNHPMRPGSEYIHISVKFLDDVMAVDLGELLLLNQPVFEPTRPAQQGRAFIALTNRAGQPVTYYSWTPPQPGTVILSSIAPAVSLAFLFVAAIVVALLARLYKSTRQIEEGRIAAEHMAFHDSLTGLANRALFEKALEAAVLETSRTQSTTALLMIDLDRFKQVNDTLGHDAGDDLIRQVPDRLDRLVDKPHTIARLGGDEFAMILSDVQSTEEVLTLANAIIRVLQRPFEVAKSQAYIGASIGICMAPDMATIGSELVRKADIALYEAKGQGRNCARLFEEAMARTVERRLVIEEQLRLALSTGEGLEVQYHPHLDQTGAEVAGVDARLHWVDPELGAVAPDEFMAVAEGTGLIQLMGMHVLRAACRYGAAHPDLRVCVRTCGSQFSDPGLADKVLAAVHAAGMLPQNLDVEVKQEELLDITTAKLENLESFKKHGVQVTLADFGGGLQSIAELAEAGVTRLKLDSGFVARLASALDPEAVAHSMRWLAQGMGLEMAADEVDTPEQKAFLDRLGCTSYRGKLFSPEGQAAWLREAGRYLESRALADNPSQPGVDWKAS